MENSDAAAVAQVRAGDPDAFRVLVERHSRSVFRLAFRMTGNEQDAEDPARDPGSWLSSWNRTCNTGSVCALRRRSLRQPGSEWGDAMGYDHEARALARDEDLPS